MLKTLKKYWKTIAIKGLELQSKIILAVVYYIFLIPFGWWFRINRHEFSSKNKQSNWHEWPHKNIEDNIRKM